MIIWITNDLDQNPDRGMELPLIFGCKIMLSALLAFHQEPLTEISQRNFLNIPSSLETSQKRPLWFHSGAFKIINRVFWSQTFVIPKSSQSLTCLEVQFFHYLHNLIILLFFTLSIEKFWVRHCSGPPVQVIHSI